MKTYFLSIGVCLLMAIAACKTSEAVKPVDSPITGDSTVACSDEIRTAAIMKIITTNCVNRGCHPGQNSPTAANFSTSDKLKGYITVSSTLFYNRVTGPQADMPQEQGFPEISRATRDSIACWVKNGMRD